MAHISRTCTKGSNPLSFSNADVSTLCCVGFFAPHVTSRTVNCELRSQWSLVAERFRVLQASLLAAASGRYRYPRFDHKNPRASLGRHGVAANQQDQPIRRPLTAPIDPGQTEFASGRLDVPRQNVIVSQRRASLDRLKDEILTGDPASRVNTAQKDTNSF